MFTEIRLALRPAISLLLVFTVLTGLAYPLVVTGLAQVLMPSQSYHKSRRSTLFIVHTSP